MDPQATEFKPPYMSFQTFWKFIEDLGSKPLPPRIDRSLMSGKSGTDQANLTAALVSFGFMEPNGTVTERLQSFAAADDDGRKKVLADLVREYYAKPLAVSESNATISTLHDTFRDSYGLSAAETRRKCETFFLHALRLADLPVSPHFPQIRSGSGAPGAPKKRLVRKRTNATVQTPLFGPPVQEDGAEDEAGDDGSIYKQTVTLRTGATMTLIVSANPFALRGSDRDFFFQIVDALVDYGEKNEDTQP